MPRAASLDLLQGTLDLLVLRALDDGPLHGYGIARRIQEATADALRIEEGSLYPALHRMEERGWIAASWGLSENNRRAKFYRLAAAGRRQLAAQESVWERFSAAVDSVLRMPKGST
jgi:transcriptional regulator